MPATVELIPRDKSNVCWLASSTMMRSWKDQVSYPLSDTLKVLDVSGGNFTQTYNADNGLSFDDNQKIVDTLGLTALPPASYTIDYFFSLLDQSPIMAVIMFSANSNIAHMVIITGISGDRTPDGTTLSINDRLPLNTGHTYTISFTDFLNKFEAVLAYENNLGAKDLTSQLYYFASAGTSSSALIRAAVPPLTAVAQQLANHPPMRAQQPQMPVHRVRRAAANNFNKTQQR